jgi:hypothetical protein
MSMAEALSSFSGVWQSSWLMQRQPGQPAFSVWMRFTAPTGKRSEHPTGMTLATHMAALQAGQRRKTQWRSSNANIRLKLRTVQNAYSEITHIHRNAYSTIEEQ